MSSYLPTRAEGRGSASPVRWWQIQSSAAVGDDGAAVSRSEYRPVGWLEAPARSTVMAGLLANGVYPDVMHSTNLRDLVDKSSFEIPWWYRTTFIVAGDALTSLRLEGVIHKADLFVNGTLVATREQIAGAYTVCSFDVSNLVRPGENALALLVHPGSPLEDLSIGWVDWNQWPPDNNMGVWRDVVVLRTGDASIVNAFVTTDLALPGLDRVGLSVSAELRNYSGDAIRAVLGGVISHPGPAASIRFRREVELGPRETTKIVVSPAEVQALSFGAPAVWWPVGEGEQPLYHLHLSLTQAGVVTDQHSSSFGIRSVTSTIEAGGGRQFVLNGRPVPIRGAGWAPDLFLRHDPGRMADELAYTIDLGLNTIRLEGKLENREFFEMTDALGLMVMPGWECCSKWEGQKSDQGEDWAERDYVVAGRSMESEAALLRGHPSVICFLIGSDFAPPPRTAATYLRALRSARWPSPVVSAATVEGTDEAGPSGMKMTGPYAWVPPVYWYSVDPAYGGAVGFNSETAAGNNIPRLPSLTRMLGERELVSLWSEPDAKQFHAGPPSEFDNLAVFHDALANRYGPPSGLRDFVRKAQLANYEACRAQFEAQGARFGAPEPATGVIYWMLNSAWPSLNWQLYDWYLDPAGSYYGAKKAHEAVHVQYAYDTGDILVVNRTAEQVGPFEARARERTLNGEVVRDRQGDVGAVGPRGAEVVLAGQGSPPGLPDGEATYFLELSLFERDDSPAASGMGSLLVSRNVYWLSTIPDVPDWAATTWRYTPTAVFCDLSGLGRLPPARLDASVEVRRRAGSETAVVKLANVSPAGTPAVGVHCSIVDRDVPVSPITWKENDFTLFGGDALETTATYSVAHGTNVRTEIEAFNLEEPIVVA